MFITFEGIDGAGKTTQVELLRRWLSAQGHQLLVTEEPTKNKVGQLLESYMKDLNADKHTEALLFAADRSEHTSKIIKPALNEKKIVICDRYVHSSLAYQSSTGLSIIWLRSLNKNNIKPDITIYLDIKPETGIERVKKRSLKIIKYEKIEMLTKVRKAYLEMKSKEFKVVDGEKNIKQVHEEIKRIINDLIR